MQKIFKVSLISFFLILSSCSTQENVNNVEVVDSPEVTETTIEPVESTESKETVSSTESEISNGYSYQKDCTEYNPDCLAYLSDEEGNRLECPSEVGCTYYYYEGKPDLIFTKDEKYIIYVNYQNNIPTLKSYRLSDGKIESLMTLYEDTDGIHFEGWSPNENKLAIFVANQNGRTDYPYMTKLFVLTIEGGKLLKKDKYNIQITYHCGDRECGPDDDIIEWVNDNQISYVHQDWVRSGESEDSKQDYIEILNL